LGNKKVASFGPKDIFGEVSLVSAKTRNATIVASEDTVCFCMYKSQFQDLVNTCPEFHSEIERLISLRSE
jgi:CRP-like cAMP-binding protein